MYFCIATVEFWENAGFDTTNWRKSVDKTKAIVHEEYAKRLINDIYTNPNIQMYISPSEEIDTLLNSSEWI